MVNVAYVGRFRKLSEVESDAGEFRRELLELIVRTTEASAGRIWNRDVSAAWTLGEETDLRRDSRPAAPPPDRSPAPAVSKLDAVRQKRQTLVLGEQDATSVFHPIQPAGDAVVELTFADARPRNTELIRQVLGVAHATVERRVMLDEQRRLRETLEQYGRERRYRDELAACEDSAAVAYTIANDGRAILDADRVSLWLPAGKRLRPKAFSGQDAVNLRNDVVDEMAIVLAELGRSKSRATAALVELDERSTDFPTWDRYRAKFGVRRMYVAPLAAAAGTAGRSGEARGVVVAEFFHRTSVAPDSERETSEIGDRRAELTEIVRFGAQVLAVHTRAETRRLPAADRLPRLGRRGWFAAAVVAVLIVLCGIDVPAGIACRGVLQPAGRRHVFAPDDATVDEVLVAGGDRVKAGQTLVRLRSAELDTQIARLLGERASCTERLFEINRLRIVERRLNSPDRPQFDAEREELQSRLESLAEQLTLRNRELAALNVVAPIDGVVSTANLRELLNERPVARGHVLMTVCRMDGPWEVRLDVAESDGGRLADALAERGELGVTFSAASEPLVDYEASVREAPLVTETAPDGAARLAVRADCRSGHASYDGGEVVAEIHAGSESLGAYLFGGIARVIRHRVLFRWF